MRALFFAIFMGIAWSGQTFAPTGDTTIFAQTFCTNQIVIINNNIYGSFKPTGIEVIPGGSYTGEDSIILVQLTFLSAVETDLNATLCEGDSIFVNGTAYHRNFYIGTETFENAASNGCDSIVHIQLQFVAPPTALLTDTLCPSDFLVVNGNRYDIERPQGTEILKDAAQYGCDSVVNIQLNFYDSAIALGGNRSAVQGDTICISVTSNVPIEAIAWSPDPACGAFPCLEFCTGLLENSLQIQATATDMFGCVVTDQIQITVRDEHQVYGPNVFTPNGPSPNDRFFLGADRGVALIRRIQIVDRWGAPVFERQNIPLESAYDQGWDGREARGRELQPGVYAWWAELENFRGKRFTRSGSVTLLR